MVTFVLRKHPPACALRGLRCWEITNWCDGRGARHRSAKPATAVRFRFAPQKQGRLCGRPFVFEMRGRTRYITLPLNPPSFERTYYFRALVVSLSFLRCESFRIHFHIPPHTPPLRQQVVVFLRGSCKPPLIASCSKDFINYIA